VVVGDLTVGGFCDLGIDCLLDMILKVEDFDPGEFLLMI